MYSTASRAQFSDAPGTEKNVICTFDNGSPQKVSCWVGTDAYTGDATSTSGLSSADSKVKVFTGLRDDPFFFNRAGFNGFLGGTSRRRRR